MNNEGYVTTVTITGDTSATNTGRKVTDSAITADTTLAYTNTRTGTVPTGIISSIVPGATALTAGIIGTLLTLKKGGQK